MPKKLDKKTIQRRIMIAWGLFFVVLITLLVAERFIELHAAFGIDGRMFFHAWFGFVSCVVFILFAKLLGFFLKRKEGYYKEGIND